MPFWFVVRAENNARRCRFGGFPWGGVLVPLGICMDLWLFYTQLTPPKFNSSLLKNDDWKTTSGKATFSWSILNPPIEKGIVCYVEKDGYKKHLDIGKIRCLRTKKTYHVWTGRGIRFLGTSPKLVRSITRIWRQITPISAISSNVCLAGGFFPPIWKIWVKLDHFPG